MSFVVRWDPQVRLEQVGMHDLHPKNNQSRSHFPTNVAIEGAASHFSFAMFQPYTRLGIPTALPGMDGTGGAGGGATSASLARGNRRCY